MRRSELRQIIQEEVKKASRKSRLQESTPDTRVRPVRPSYGTVTGRPVSRADIEPEPFEDLPKHSGMRRTRESKIQIKTGDLRKIIQEEISKSVDLDEDIEAKKEEVEALEKFRDLHDKHPELEGALTQESTRGAARRAAIAADLEHEPLTQYDSYTPEKLYDLGWDVGMRLKRITVKDHQYLVSEYPSYELGFNAAWPQQKSQEEREQTYEERDQTYMYEVWMGKQPDKRTDAWVAMNRRRRAFRRMLSSAREIPGTLKYVNYDTAHGARLHEVASRAEVMKRWNEIADAWVEAVDDDSVPVEVAKSLLDDLKAFQDEVKSTIDKAEADARRKYGVAPPRWLTAESLQSMIFEELAAVGAASPQGQQGVKSKKDKAVCGCGCPKCTQPGADAFAYEILVSGDEDKFEGS